MQSVAGPSGLLLACGVSVSPQYLQQIAKLTFRLPLHTLGEYTTNLTGGGAAEDGKEEEEQEEKEAFGCDADIVNEL